MQVKQQPQTRYGKNGHAFLGITKNCQNCKKEFYVPNWLLQRNGGKYCSKPCYWKDKHDSPWNKNTKGKIKPNKTSFKPLGSTFKGTASQYKALHRKINRLFGKPDTCEKCGRNNLHERSIHWANVSGNYLPDSSDWIRLCAKCHFIYDYKYHIGIDYERNIL